MRVQTTYWENILAEIEVESEVDVKAVADCLLDFGWMCSSEDRTEQFHIVTAVATLGEPDVENSTTELDSDFQRRTWEVFDACGGVERTAQVTFQRQHVFDFTGGAA